MPHIEMHRVMLRLLRGCQYLAGVIEKQPTLPPPRYSMHLSCILLIRSSGACNTNASLAAFMLPVCCTSCHGDAWRVLQSAVASTPALHMQLAFMEAVVTPSFRALLALAPNTAAAALANIEAAQAHWRSGAVPWREWLSPGHDDFEPHLEAAAT